MVEFTILVETESSPACSSFQFINDRHGTLSFLAHYSAARVHIHI